ncbi:hypothetical protein [Bartonella massiliensis]|uniref:hypothetical protein n=1 Tax=Bartonella massiliensis TaxID=929795 RepID=UPI001159CF76|nr:hypothetical protein [Bartonella massiliensis]
MDHRELFICASVFTTASFFSLIAEISKCSVQTPSPLSDSYESAVKSKYKSLPYKLWQYTAKNKPSAYNDNIVYYNNKKHAHIQQLFIPYKCSLKIFSQLKNDIKQAISIDFDKLLLLKSCFFCLNSNNIYWHNKLYFVPRIDLTSWIFASIKNILKKEQSNNHKEYSKWTNLVLQIYKIKKQRQKASRRMGIYINKILHNRVYC